MAAEGAKLLDERGPEGWARKIGDFDTIDMSAGRQCALARLYGSYIDGKNALRIGSYDAINHGFLIDKDQRDEGLERDYALLKEAWRPLIEQRLTAY